MTDYEGYHYSDRYIQPSKGAQLTTTVNTLTGYHNKHYVVTSGHSNTMDDHEHINDYHNEQYDRNCHGPPVNYKCLADDSGLLASSYF